MTDKRTTPEAPEAAPQAAAAGPRRKKRAGPTIDLTATEMPPPGTDPPAAEPEQAAPRHGGPMMMPALAGVAGGAIVALVLLALWLTGVLPVRYAAPADTSAQVAALATQLRDLQNRPAPAADTKAIDALTRRVSRIEDTISKLPTGDAGMAERIAAADGAMKSLGIALAALNRRTDDIAAAANQARERADAAAKAVADLQSSVQDTAKTAAGISPAELDAVQKRIAALEQSAQAARADIAKASAADVAARQALSAAGLRDAALSGAAFTAELAQARSFGADEKILAPLAPFAATGVPAAPALARDLRALLLAMLKISGAQAPQGGFLERLQANAGKLVRIRPVDAPPGDDASAVLARIEIDAAKADIAGALGDLAKLNAATRAPAQAWIDKATARQAALAAARQYAADAARTLGPR